MSNPQIALLSLDLHIPMSQSLKEKRRVLKSFKDRVRARFNVSIAEVGDRDKWQRAQVGICALSAEKTYLDQKMQHILSLLDTISDIQLMDHDLQFI